MIEVICNDRLGRKIRVKANSDDTIGDLKKILAAQTGTRPEKIRLQKWYTVFKDHITLQDYEGSLVFSSWVRLLMNETNFNLFVFFFWYFCLVVCTVGDSFGEFVL